LAGRPEHDGRERPRALSGSTTKPHGGVEHRRTPGQSEPQVDLLERILSRQNMQHAWKRVKANRGAAGVDAMTTGEFPEFARDHWPEIRSALREGRYRPQPVRRVDIPKATGGTRPLGIPTVVDRVIQQAIAQVLSPIYEPDFSAHIYGFRPGRSAHGAVRAVQVAWHNGYRVAVDADLSKFFDRVNHDVLMRLLAQRVADRRVLKLIGRYLRAGVRIDGRVQPTTEGVPQGGPLSPLLANVVLHELDRELERRGHRFARYADDFIILVKSQRAGERVFAGIGRFLERRLKLVVNEQKSKVASLSACTFLGFCFVRGKLRWSEAAFGEFKRRVRGLTGRSWGVSMAHRLHKLRRYVRGWMNYFGILEYYRPLPGLDQWLRRRVRMCYWKMWKRPRKRMAELMKLGTHPKVAICTGRSRKRLLATQPDPGHANRHDQRLAHGPRRALDPAAVDRPSLPVVTIGGRAVMNRRLRTRMTGGVAFLLPTSIRGF